jgi:RHS repeat-associated protein
VTERFVWDGQNVSRKESSAPGVGNDIIRTTDYPGYWGGLASLFDSIAGSQILAIDPQGNVRLVLQGGSVAGTGAYTGFGEVLSDPGIPFAYVGLFGYQWDNPVYYVRARNYDPVTGRWFSRDPIGEIWPLIADWGEGANGATVGSAFARGGFPRAAFDLIGTMPDAPGRWSLYQYCDRNPVVCVDASGMRSDCSKCAANIILEWWNTPHHSFNHLYIHCLACCTLARIDGDPNCANKWQDFQNRWSPEQTPRFKMARKEACRAGVRLAPDASGKYTARQCIQCHDLCLRQYPPTPPRKWVSPIPSGSGNVGEMLRRQRVAEEGFYANQIYKHDLWRRLGNPCEGLGTDRRP